MVATWFCKRSLLIVVREVVKRIFYPHYLKLLAEVVMSKWLLTGISVLVQLFNTGLLPSASRPLAAARQDQCYSTQQPLLIGVPGERRGTAAELGERGASKVTLPGLSVNWHSYVLYYLIHFLFGELE